MQIERLILGSLKCSLAMVLSVAAYAATSGNTALVDAAKSQDSESVRALLKQHVDVNAPEPDGTTALHWAAHWGDLETVDLLLREGANVTALNRYGATPLSEAVHIGSGEAQHLPDVGQPGIRAGDDRDPGAGGFPRLGS